MKNLTKVSAALILGTGILSSCATDKMAMNSANDNLYFMASDIKVATQYAVQNNKPESFKEITQDTQLLEENFSSRNVNPEYISRYSQQTTESGDEVVYFDDNATQASANGTAANIDVYNNYYVNGGGNNAWNRNVNFGLGMGFFSPWGMGFYDPFFMPGWGMPGWGFRPGFNISMSFGWGRPMFRPWGFGGFGGGFYDPFWDPFWGNSMAWGGGFGSPWGWGRPIYAGRPIYVLPGGETGGRRIVQGARPTRGSSYSGTGLRSSSSAIAPSTSRAQARSNASTNPSARRLVSGEASRATGRDFNRSENDYYNSGRSRVTPTTRNYNSPAADRSVSTRPSGATLPSARPSMTRPSSGSYATPGRSNTPGRAVNPTFNNRSTSPSYNRSVSPSYNRSTSPSYNRSTTPSYNNRSTTPTRSSSPTFSSPSRSSSGGGFSAPSRSSGGSSGGSVGGSRGGRGN
jgi:hypothetical protein